MTRKPRKPKQRKKRDEILVRLRRHGVPINDDGILTDNWEAGVKGQRMPRPNRRALLLALDLLASRNQATRDERVHEEGDAARVPASPSIPLRQNR